MRAAVVIAGVAAVNNAATPAPAATVATAVAVIAAAVNQLPAATATATAIAIAGRHTLLCRRRLWRTSSSSSTAAARKLRACLQWVAWCNLRLVAVFFFSSYNIVFVAWALSLR